MKWIAFQSILFPIVSSFVRDTYPSFVRPRVYLSAMPGKDKAKFYPFQEARKIARGHGFSSKDEFIDYCCPGAYQLPKNPEEVWFDDWNGWVRSGNVGLSLLTQFRLSLVKHSRCRLLLAPYTNRTISWAFVMNSNPVVSLLAS